MWILPLPSHDLGIVPLFCGNFLESMRSFVFWFEMDWELDLSRRIVEWIGNSPSRKELVCSYFFTRSELKFSPLSGMNWVLHLGTWNQLYLECLWSERISTFNLVLVTWHPFRIYHELGMQCDFFLEPGMHWEFLQRNSEFQIPEHFIPIWIPKKQTFHRISRKSKDLTRIPKNSEI